MNFRQVLPYLCLLAIILGLLMLKRSHPNDKSSSPKSVASEASHARAHKHRFTWSAPSEQCAKKFGVNLRLDNNLIAHNRDFSFNPEAKGDRIALFYEQHLGLYPWLKKVNDKTFLPINGGIPQMVNFTAHLSKAKEDIEQRIPDPEFDGLAIIDWESWRFTYQSNWATKRIYKLYSRKLVRNTYGSKINKGQERRIAERTFDYGAKKLVLSTLFLAKKLRPKAKWGFYMYPECFSYDDSVCSSKAKWSNSQLDWLYDEVDALYPSMYYNHGTAEMSFETRYDIVSSQITEAYRVRKNRKMGLYIFAKLAYNTYDNTLDFYTEEDLCLSFLIPHLFGVDGIIVWSSYRSFTTQGKCNAFAEYLTAAQPYLKLLKLAMAKHESQFLYFSTNGTIKHNCPIRDMCRNPSQPYAVCTGEYKVPTTTTTATTTTTTTTTATTSTTEGPTSVEPSAPDVNSKIDISIPIEPDIKTTALTEHNSKNKTKFKVLILPDSINAHATITESKNSNKKSHTDNSPPELFQRNTNVDKIGPAKPIRRRPTSRRRPRPIPQIMSPVDFNFEINEVKVISNAFKKKQSLTGRRVDIGGRSRPVLNIGTGRSRNRIYPPTNHLTGSRNTGNAGDTNPGLDPELESLTRSWNNAGQTDTDRNKDMANNVEKYREIEQNKEDNRGSQQTTQNYDQSQTVPPLFTIENKSRNNNLNYKRKYANKPQDSRKNLFTTSKFATVSPAPISISQIDTGRPKIKYSVIVATAKPESGGIQSATVGLTPTPTITTTTTSILSSTTTTTTITTPSTTTSTTTITTTAPTTMITPAPGDNSRSNNRPTSAPRDYTRYPSKITRPTQVPPVNVRPSPKYNRENQRNREQQSTKPMAENKTLKTSTKTTESIPSGNDTDIHFNAGGFLMDKLVMPLLNYFDHKIDSVDSDESADKGLTKKPVAAGLTAQDTTSHSYSATDDDDSMVKSGNRFSGTWLLVTLGVTLVALLDIL